MIKIPKITQRLVPITKEQWNKEYDKTLAFPVPYQFRYAYFPEAIFVLDEEIYYRYNNSFYKSYFSRWTLHSFKRSIRHRKEINRDVFFKSFKKLQNKISYLHIPDNFADIHFKPVYRPVYLKLFFKKLKKQDKLVKVSSFFVDKRGVLLKRITAVDRDFFYATDISPRGLISYYESPISNLHIRYVGTKLEFNFKDALNTARISEEYYNNILSRAIQIGFEVW